MAYSVPEKLDWSGCPIVQREPGKLGGAPNVAGMRITPEAILDNYEDGCSIAEISDEIFPGVSQEQIRIILRYACDKGYCFVQ
jgi:uncharacterized protein (DUF433 family)